MVSSFDTLTNNETKKYVSNRKDLENYKIELTADNFKDFFELKVTFSEYSVESRKGLFASEYDCYCTQKSVIQPKATFKCNDVYVTINYNYTQSDWNGGYLNNVMLYDNGYFEESKEIHADSGLLKIDAPVFFDNKCTVENISGYLTLE